MERHPWRPFTYLFLGEVGGLMVSTVAVDLRCFASFTVMKRPFLASLPILRVAIKASLGLLSYATLVCFAKTSIVHWSTTLRSLAGRMT